MALSIISFNQIYLKLTFDKRRILPNFDTVPFGYVDNDDDDNEGIHGHTDDDDSDDDDDDDDECQALWSE